MPNGRAPFLYNDDHLVPSKSDAGPGSDIPAGSFYERAKQRLRLAYSHTVQWGQQEWNAHALDYEGARCILQAAFLAENYAPEAILAETGYELASLLEGLLPGLLQMLAVVGATTLLGGVIGGIIGAFAGGVGAIPGAAVGGELGLDVGMAILTWMGLAFLAVAIVKGFGQLIEALHAGITTAWTARNKRGMEERLQVERAARELARAVGILMRLILIGIVAYLLKKAAVKSTSSAVGTVKNLQSVGATEVSSATVADLVGKLRASRLGKSGFADWVEKNWQKLVKDPKLQENTLDKGSAAPVKDDPAPAPPKQSNTPAATQQSTAAVAPDPEPQAPQQPAQPLTAATADSQSIDALKAANADAVAKCNTFTPQGVSQADADAYLASPDGQQYLQNMKDASPGLSDDAAYRYSQQQIMSGSDLPTMTTGYDQPLYKVVPSGQSVGAKSPFFATQDNLNSAISSGQPVGDSFGLPLSSQASSYDVYQINPPAGGGTIFTSTVAPTSELGGQFTTSGGAAQDLVPNRSGWSAPTKIGTIPNAGGSPVSIPGGTQ